MKHLLQWQTKSEQYFEKDIVWKCDQRNLAIIASHNDKDKC